MEKDLAGTPKPEQYVRVARLADIQGTGCLVVHVREHTLVLFRLLLREDRDFHTILTIDEAF